MDWLDGLNDSQRAAVEYCDGPELVIAGAGSGKTRVLTYKIAYLLEQGIPANRILALTFTNKAAREMKERIQRLVNAEDARYLWMGTFHSVCGRLLRSKAEKLGYTKDFTIYDTTDSKSLIKSICKELELEDKVYKPSLVLSRISSLKNSFVTPADYAADTSLQREDKYARLYNLYDIYRLYQIRMKSNNAMDFDDMLLETLKLMRQFPEIREEYQQLFLYLLVDEYQDTNKVQYLLVKELAAPQNNICVVGDDAQSIYSFRGADIGNILNFQKQFSNAKLFKLERNYRSTKNIVNASNSLIVKNKEQIFKDVYSEKEDGPQLCLEAYNTDKLEAKGVVDQIIRSHSRSQIPYNNIAILYRTNVQSRLFEDELRKQNIPYRVYGNVSFYQRKEIKDIVSYLRIAVNPLDNEALLRAISIYSGIGATTMKKVVLCATEHKESYLKIMTNPAEFGMTGDAMIKKLQSFAQKIENLSENSSNLSASEFVSKALEVAGISLNITDPFDTDEMDRIQNLQSFVQQIKDFENEHKTEDSEIIPIHEFLYEVSLLTDQDDRQNESTDSVTLMTVHSAKGLEFPVVFITGLEDGIFPSRHSMGEWHDQRELEEERRLFYVAITRAMERCYLCYAKQRFVNGEIKLQKESIFLNDIDEQYVKSSNLKYPETYKTHWSYTAPSRAAFSSAHPAPPAMPSIKPDKLTKVADNKSQISNVKSQIDAPWAAGTRIRHAVFGEGTVQRVYEDQMTGNEKIEILFDTKGQKTLLLTYAKLERI
ncbi:MAG: exodeoxyribonuclease V subunit gamma [Paludibacteraceae bacterium]|nr:exodeoxyribonuclease V subunit gamma [Paludibacteraceae bacterium]